MKCTRLIGSLALTTAAGLALAACSSGSKSETASNSTSIKIMQIATSGVPGLPNPADGLTAAIGGINATGGINGQHIDLIVCNAGPTATGGSAQANAACATKAVSDHVVALVGTASVFSQVIYPIIEKAGIPDINVPFTAADNTNALSYPVIGASTVAFVAVGQMLADQGCKNTAILSLGPASQFDTILAGPAEAGLTHGGSKVAGKVYVPVTQTDLTAAVASIDQMDADCLVAAIAPNQSVGLFQAIKSSGHPLKVGGNDNLVPKSLLQSSAGALAEGFYVASLNRPIAPYVQGATNTPAAQQLLSDMSTYKAKTADAAMYAPTWAMGQIFAQAARAAAKNGPITAASVRSALDGLCNVDTGVTPGLNFCKPGPVAAYPRLSNYEAYVEQVRNKQLTVVTTTPLNLSAAVQQIRK